MRREVAETSNTPTKSTSRSDVQDHGKEPYTRPTRKVSEPTPHYTSQEYGRLKETRPEYEGDSRRSSGAGVTSSRDVFSRRTSGESERELGSRRVYSSSRVIEIEDDDDPHRARSVFRLPQEHKETSVRRYVEEPSRGVIHLTDAYWTDLEEWLEFTGYHDRVYRKEALHRHKEIIELDHKRAALARESQVAQEERAYMTRGHSIAPRDELAVGVSRVSTLSRPLRSAPMYEMAPPPLPIREEREVLRSIDRPEPAAAAASTLRSKPAYVPAATAREEGSARLRYVEPPATQAEAGTLKRRYRTDDDDEGRPSEKLVRVDVRGRGIARRDEDEEELVPRPVRTYAETERDDRRAREVDSGSERRLINDLVRLRGQEGSQTRSKDLIPRARETPAPMMVREPSRALTPPPREPGEEAEPRSRRTEEGKTKVTQNDTPSRGQGGYSRDISPPRKPQNEVAMRSSGYQGTSWRDARDDPSDKHSPNEGRGYYQPRGGYGNHPQPYAPRGRGRGRGGSAYYNPRLDNRIYNHNHAYMRQQPGAQSLNLLQGGQ